MPRRHPQTSNILNSRTLYALIILPAVALGVLAMIAGGVSPMLWGQQAAAWLLFSLLLLIPRRALCRVPSFVWTALLVLILAASLLGPEAGGARRWIDLAPLSVNAAQLALPALLVLLCGMPMPQPALLCAAAVLCLQPDVSQLAALFLAALPLLWRCRKNRLLSAGSLVLMAVCLVRGFLAPVSLEPVAYCEGILSMLGDHSALLQVIGVLSLVLIPGFFACRFLRARSLQSLCLALYYGVTLLFALSGAYPVPFMGFGLSVIAGYFLAYAPERC